MMSFLEGSLGADFRNLSFEAGRIPQGYDSLAPKPGEREMILPGWEPFFGQACADPSFAFLPYLIVDAICIGSPCVALWSTDQGRGGIDPFSGRYMLHIQGPQFCQNDIPSETGILQTAIVPEGVRSLSFLARFDGIMRVSIAEREVKAIPQEVFDRYTRYAVDVSEYAGHEVELRIAAVPTLLKAGFASIFRHEASIALDDFRFSPDPVIVPPGPVSLEMAKVPYGYWMATFTGILEFSEDMGGPWTPIEGLGSPAVIQPNWGPRSVFFRARSWIETP